MMKLDVHDPRLHEDPYPIFERLVREAPVHRAPGGRLVFCTYRDCRAIFRSPGWSSDERNSRDYRAYVEEHGKPRPDMAALGSARPIVFTDPPDHRRLRGLVGMAFPHDLVTQFRPRVHALVEQFITELEPNRFDLMEGLAYRMPLHVIGELMGIPPEDLPQLRAWSEELAASLDPDELQTDSSMARTEHVLIQVAKYFGALIMQRKEAPGTDLLSVLIEATEDGSQLDMMELIQTAMFLVSAGFETTANTLGNGIECLLHHPEQLRAIRKEPDLIPCAVEEVLRFVPPIQMVWRIALEDTEIRGVKIAAGEKVTLLVAAANRDPEAFSQPNRFDIRRAEQRHLSFGFGAHHCLGAALARMQVAVVLDRLLHHFPVLHLLEIERRPTVAIRGSAHLWLSAEGA